MIQTISSLPSPRCLNTQKEEKRVFNHMKLANKVMIALAVSALITVFVGVFGNYGMNQVMESQADIATVRLPSVAAILSISEAQTAVDSAENALLCTKIDVATKQEQYDRFDDAKKRADDAWKIYEPLPQTEEEARVWKQFVPAWEKWWKDHMDYVALTKKYETDKSDETYDAMVKQALVTNGVSFKAAEDLLNKLTDINMAEAKKSYVAADKHASVTKMALIIATVLSALLAVMVAVFLRKNVASIIKGLLDETRNLVDAATNGKLATRADSARINFEFRGIGTGLNETLDAVFGPLNVGAEYVDRISKGDIPPKITDSYNGDFNEIKNNLNQCIDAISLLVTDAGGLVEAAIHGWLATRADATKHQGEYKKIIQGVNDTLNSVVGFIDAMPAMFMIVDNEFNIRYMNTVGAQVGNRNPKDLVGTKCYEHFKTSDCRTSKCACANSMQSGAGATSETDAHPGTLNLDISYSTLPVKNREGEVIGVAVLAQDMTERKRAEEEIHRLNAELEQRVFDRTVQLEAANQELDAFAYSVSHDLRAPLRHIDGFLELLQKSIAVTLNERSRHYMDTISNSTMRMGILIDDLLSFSRMGRNQMSKMRVDLGELTQEVILEFQPETGNRNIYWRICDLPVVNGDRAMLRIVLVNLISNALKFTQPRRQAEIEIGWMHSQESETVIFVRDNGVGFDMNYVDRLFGVFQRLHRAEEFEGTGIGLANVRRIINRHGGRTWAEGQVNNGATFYFSLPQTIQET
jgi:signal transduction histidine kinase